MKQYLSVTITVEIDDAEEFARTARERAQADGLRDGDLEDYTAEDLGACAVMIFDPGTSPFGCTILDSTAECFTDRLGGPTATARVVDAAPAASAPPSIAAPAVPGAGLAATVAWTELRAAMAADGIEVPERLGPSATAWFRDLAREVLSPSPTAPSAQVETLVRRLRTLRRPYGDNTPWAEALDAAIAALSAAAGITESPRAAVAPVATEIAVAEGEPAIDPRWSRRWRQRLHLDPLSREDVSAIKALSVLVRDHFQYTSGFGLTSRKASNDYTKQRAELASNFLKTHGNRIVFVLRMVMEAARVTATKEHIAALTASLPVSHSPTQGGHHAKENADGHRDR